MMKSLRFAVLQLFLATSALAQSSLSLNIVRNGDAFDLQWSARQNLVYQPLLSTDLAAWSAFGPTRSTTLATEEMTVNISRGFIDEGKPPALLGDSQSLTVPGVPGWLVMCDRSK